MALAKARQYTVSASSAKTVTGNSGIFGVVDNFDEMLAVLNVTAASSPTSLDVAYQVSCDGGTTWVTHTSFTQVTGTSATELKQMTNIGMVGRFLWTIVGTSFTFSINVTCKRRG